MDRPSRPGQTTRLVCVLVGCVLLVGGTVGSLRLLLDPGHPEHLDAAAFRADTAALDAELDAVPDVVVDAPIGRNNDAAQRPPESTAAAPFVPHVVAHGPDWPLWPARVASPAHSTAPGRITRVRVPRIGIDASVVPTRLVDSSAGTTWDIPAFKAGHGPDTAGPGEPGNAVLVGHVSSRSAGNVFGPLARARTGDRVEVFGAGGIFEYRVVELRKILRTDVSVLRPTQVPSVSLITCTGEWLPLLRDYDARLVVRGELVTAALAG